MAQREARILKVLVASPGDVSEERDTVSLVAGELNSTFTAHLGLRLEVLRWETDAYAGFHADGPQGLIDDVLNLEDCDILVGVFWKRFGTPTATAGSGTEHEILAAYERWRRDGSRPQIMVYFKDKAFNPQQPEELDQWRKVLEFKRRFPKEGLWWSYKRVIDFERLIRRQLTAYLLENAGELGGRTYTLIRGEQELSEVNSRIVEGAESVLFVTGSRSRNEPYLTSIRDKVAATPGLVHYRVLFGPPHHEVFRQHLASLVAGTPPIEPRRLRVALYDNAREQFETFILGNEHEAIVVLPSFTRPGVYDSALLFTWGREVDALRRFVSELYSAGVKLETAAQIAALAVVRQEAASA